VGGVGEVGQEDVQHLWAVLRRLEDFELDVDPFAGGHAAAVRLAPHQAAG
jgi:hypothetical protein